MIFRYAIDRDPTGVGHWANPPLLTRAESTFMMHACGYSQIHLDFDFFRNEALERLMTTGKIVYGQHFRIAVYFGKAPGFPQFGSDGNDGKCTTETINNKLTHSDEKLRTEMKYNQDTIDGAWSTLREDITNPAVVESVARPVYIDWTNWKSCEWCLYGDAMPSKCLRRIDPFANPPQYSYINYFSAYNDQMFDECQAPRVHEKPCQVREAFIVHVGVIWTCLVTFSVFHLDMCGYLFCVPLGHVWSPLIKVYKIHARITWGVALIRANFFHLFLLMFDLHDRSIFAFFNV
jgi:hypothetical protein